MLEGAKILSLIKVNLECVKKTSSSVSTLEISIYKKA